MRRTIVAGNWKMHHTQSETRQWADACHKAGPPRENVDVYIFPAYTCLAAARESFPATIVVGAQNLHEQPHGAFTGEIAAAMIADVGAAAVLVGHSERRQLFGEDSDRCAPKLAAALEGGLLPFYCVGETLDQREADEAEKIVFQQLEEGLAALTPADISRMVIAYEPVWAIGTGRTATPDDAAAMHRSIRQFFGSKYGNELADSIQILYGGSVKGSNAAEMLASPDVDGFLVGGASLQWADFQSIIEGAAQRRH